jgi:hypothetical protein
VITDLLLNVKLPFDTRRRRARSEGVIHRLTALMAHVNLLYLSEHPETPLLYESGVRYMLPDQVRAPRINPAKLKDLVKFLRSAEASHETIVTVLRFLVGMESFCDIPMLLERGGGDCNQLSPWRLAELWRGGGRGPPLHT